MQARPLQGQYTMTHLKTQGRPLTEAVHLLASLSFQSILAQKVLQDVGEE